MREKLRRLEALLFASTEPLEAKALARCLDGDDDVNALLAELQREYKDRGVTLVRVAGRWQFRTAEDLSYLLERQQKEERRLSKAALETLAIIAYHQPVTRAEIEEIRGVSTSPGTLDVLMETSWIRPAWPPPRARPAADLRHDGRLPRAFRPRQHQGSAGPRRSQGCGAAWMPICRPTSRCRRRPTSRR